jgi:hypothetical protein
MTGKTMRSCAMRAADNPQRTDSPTEAKLGSTREP